MNKYGEKAYSTIKKWASVIIREGHYSWDDLENLRIDEGAAQEVFDKLKYEEHIVPDGMKFGEWSSCIREIKSDYTRIFDFCGIPEGKVNNFEPPDRNESAWSVYKNLLLGRMSRSSVDSLEKSCNWILNHISLEATSENPVKGLVMGSVQSGKTANMIGLVTMAADYDWNVFVVLSGTIENLRQQTQARFANDLLDKGRIMWHVLDRTGNPDILYDVSFNRNISWQELRFDGTPDGPEGIKDRYVFICLKNSKRLQNLIYGLHSVSGRTQKMRAIVIDDEADQASVNTRKMPEMSEEEIKERTRVNKLIINLVNGKNSDGKRASSNFQAMNYICYTATPYANVLNEANGESLYPRNFICSLPESDEYFGLKAIFGDRKDDNMYSGLTSSIIRTIPDEESNYITDLDGGKFKPTFVEFQKSVAWFLCSAAVLRYWKYKKPISMLIHTTAKQNGHQIVYKTLENWLKGSESSNEILRLCHTIYEDEKNRFTKAHLEEGYPSYARLNEVRDDFPPFEEIEDDIIDMLGCVENIKFDQDGQFRWQEKGIHICIDNCSSNRLTVDGSYLRIRYPNSDELRKLNKAPVFIVIGGNTLSRGLTLEGLVVSYFARNVTQADTLLQMARWFGYRRGYELLQRVWITDGVQKKFDLIEEIDEDLKDELEDFKERAVSPSEYGPRVLTTSGIAKFNLTAKNKQQNAVSCEFDFTGNSYELRQFKNEKDVLDENISVTDKFLNGLNSPVVSDAVDCALVWKRIESEKVISEFIEKYSVFDCSPLKKQILCFNDWMREMNACGKFLFWNVAVAGTRKESDKWPEGSIVGKIERSKKRDRAYIDIGSLRSGRDILADISICELPDDKKKVFSEEKRLGKYLINLRSQLGLNDVPLLLLYRINKNGGSDSAGRIPIGSASDIVAFSIIVPGQKSNKDYVKKVTVRMPEEF